MKNRILTTIVSAVLVTGLLASCDLFDKVDDVSFTADIKKSFNVSGAEEGAYADQIVLDATSDSEINKYKEKITDIEVNKVTYRVSNYSGPDGATFDGEMLFDASGGSASGSLGSVSISSVNLGTASSAGTEFELDLEQSEVDAIAAQLQDNNTVTATMDGTISAGPVSFTVEVVINAKITADAL
ncbi:MAG: hypothetical protein AB7O48_01640 [Cyclobacteriaceae bacterium]